MVEIAEHDPIWERLTMSSSLIFQQFKMHLLLCNYAFIIFLRLGLKDHRLTFYMSNYTNKSLTLHEMDSLLWRTAK